MAKFRYEGREFDLVNPTVGETRWAERQLGQGVSSWTDSEKMFALALLSLRRAGLALTWSDMEALELDAVEVVDEPEPAEEVPTTAGDEAGENEPSENDETNTSST